MKIQSLILGAAVVLTGMTACSKDESTPAGKQTKSISISIANADYTVKGRAVGDAQPAEQVELKSFKVFFLNSTGDVIDLGTDFQGPGFYFDTTDDNYTLPTADKPLTYHFLPPQVAGVAILGNVAEDAEYSATSTHEVLNDDATGHPAYPLFGASALAPGNTDETQHTNVFTASVNLVPAMSRMEVHAFQYKEAEGATAKYQKVELNKIALNNYYTQYTATIANYTVTSAGVANSLKNVQLDNNTVYNYVNNATAPWADGLQVALAPNAIQDHTGITTVLATNATTPAGKVLTYGIVGKMPQLAAIGTADGTPVYLIGDFSTTYANGKVYRVNYIFDDEDLELPNRCVKLDVTVADWSVEVITPNFGA